MDVLLRRHLAEHLRRGGKPLFQVLRESEVNAGVLFLGGNGDGQDFALAQLGKLFGRVYQSCEGHRNS